jgi:hypothetical protein
MKFIVISPLGLDPGPHWFVPNGNVLQPKLDVFAVGVSLQKSVKQLPSPQV